MIDPVTSISSVSSFVRAPKSEVSAPASSSFADMLANKAQEVGQNLSNAERVSSAGLSGDANIREVVDTVMQAERSLQMAVTVREKVVNAYLDLTRMSI